MESTRKVVCREDFQGKALSMQMTFPNLPLKPCSHTVPLSARLKGTLLPVSACAYL